MNTFVIVSGIGKHRETCTICSLLGACVAVVKGEQDEHLNLSFKAKIVVEMVNWRDDKGYHEVTFDFSGIYIINRVTDVNRIRGPSFGNQQFTSHSSPPYNPTTNTEYLQDECLRLR